MPITSIIEAAAFRPSPAHPNPPESKHQIPKRTSLSLRLPLRPNPIASFLLDQGIDPAAGTTSMGQTGMHFAADGGHLETIQMLIERKVPLNIKNKYGGTVLGQALWSAANEPKPSHPAIIDLLENAS